MIVLIIIALLIIMTLVAIVNMYYMYKHAHYNNYSSISFKESVSLTDMPIITFISKGNKINMLLDTGCTITSFDVGCKDLLDFRISGQTNFTQMGLEGNRFKVDGGLCQMQYDKYNFIFRCTITDLSQAFSDIKKSTGVQLHGILGTEFFIKYKYVLDFEEFKVKFRK